MGYSPHYSHLISENDGESNLGYPKDKSILGKPET